MGLEDRDCNLCEYKQLFVISVLMNFKNSMTLSFHFPPGGLSFELLSPRSFALLSNYESGSISIYYIDYPRNPIISPLYVAKLMMPTLLPGIRLVSLQSHTGPFLGKPRGSGLFTTSPDARIHVITAQYINATLPHATFFIHRSAFTPYMQSDVPLDPISEISWEKWTQHKYFFDPLQLSTNWLRQV